MDDGGQPNNSFGNGQQQRNQQHSRPFFYVQPASQPYVPMYPHWHLNNPYHHYGMPGGYNMARPYGQPYPYMQYPGYMPPQQIIHPMDYRRMFEPRFHPPPWADMPRPPQQQQQYPPPASPVRREVACTEVQTDPSDAISKLIECLGKIRGGDLSERELDSGVGSQASGIFSPGDEKKCEEECATRAATSTLSSSSSSGAQPSPAVIFSDSMTAVYDAESSRQSLEDLGTPGAWSVGFEELPLDTSSVREEVPGGQEPSEVFTLCLPGPLADRVPTAGPADERPAVVTPGVLADEPRSKPEMEAVVPQAQQTRCATGLQDAEQGEPTFRIVRLPFAASPPSAADLAIDSPSLHGTGSARLTSSCLSSPASPLYYGYLPRRKNHGRTSVLSPSLDELSSRDELFSTDLDDMDLFPGRVYTSRKLADTTSRSLGHLAAEEAWPAGFKRYACACCGKGLAKAQGASRSKGMRPYQDETGDSEEECRYASSQPERLAPRRPAAPRKMEAIPLRHSSKHPHKRVQCTEGPDTADRQEAREHRTGEEDDDGETGEMTGSDLQYPTCQDQLCRQDQSIGRWAEESQPRSRLQGQLHKPEMYRKVLSKPMSCQRTRDEDKTEVQPSRYRWE